MEDQEQCRVAYQAAIELMSEECGSNPGKYVSIADMLIWVPTPIPGLEDIDVPTVEDIKKTEWAKKIVETWIGMMFPFFSYESEDYNKVFNNMMEAITEAINR